MKQNGYDQDDIDEFLSDDVFFFVKKNTDVYVGGCDLIVVFGMEHEIKDDSLQCACEMVNCYGAILKVGKFVTDDGHLCEDYLCAVTNDKTTQEINDYCKSLGFKEDARLDTCGWG